MTCESSAIVELRLSRFALIARRVWTRTWWVGVVVIRVTIRLSGRVRRREGVGRRTRRCLTETRIQPEGTSFEYGVRTDLIRSAN
jgi:hypothetical protein